MCIGTLNQKSYTGEMQEINDFRVLMAEEIIGAPNMTHHYKLGTTSTKTLSNFVAGGKPPNGRAKSAPRRENLFHMNQKKWKP